MYRKLEFIVVMLLILFAYSPAHATVYLNLNAEEGTVGTVVPLSLFHQDDPPQTPYGGARATYQSSGGTLQGSKYYQWQTVNNQLDHYAEIDTPSGPVTNIIGKTFYLAYYFRFDRINGLDIWHECAACQSADKGVYLWGDNLRWTVSRGEWYSYAQNQDHRYTVWVGDYNAYNLNPELKSGGVYGQNQNGYSWTNPIQLQYERWYSLVFALKVAPDKTGSFALYIDGVKISEYTNIQTVFASPATITRIVPGGTLAQPAYDAPEHYRKFDAFILTDDWQDIVDGGYLSGGDTQAPSVPANLLAQANSSSQINLSWTASTDNVGVTGYNIYRDGALLDTSATNFYTNIGLSASTTYTYSVSAYDAVGNASSQSSSASATTSSGGGGGGDTGGNASSGGEASGGSGCGFVKDDSKGQKAKGEGLIMMILLFLLLFLLKLNKRYRSFSLHRS